MTLSSEFYAEFLHLSGVQLGAGQKFDVSLFVIIIKRAKGW